MTTIRRGDTKRLKVTFTDVDDAVFDPDSSTLTIYDPDGTTNTTKALADFTRVSEGIYYYDFAVPSDATYGMWVATWAGTSGSFVCTGMESFNVGKSTTPTTDDVRVELNNISTDRVSDEVAAYNLERSRRRVEGLASSSANNQDVNDAIVACAAYRCYVGYALEVERGAGRMPPAIETNLRRLQEECIYWRARVQGYTATSNRGEVFKVMTMPYSIQDQDHEPGTRLR